MNNLQKSFLFTTCISAFGDALLYLALPIGLGLSTGKIEDAIILFLIPALFMFASSFISEKLIRQKEMNKDYGSVLVGLGLLELAIATLCILSPSIEQKKIFMYLFVAIYAFGKEGLPKLYYNFEIYKFFFTEKEYGSAVARTKSLIIVGGLLGMCSSAFLIEAGLWDYSLLLDSFTFLLLGFIISKGSSFKTSEHSEAETEDSNSELSPEHNYIHFIVPFYIFISSLFWPFLPLINKMLGVATVSDSILTLALFKIPGILAGFKFDTLKDRYGLNALLYLTPWLALTSTLLYMFIPNFGSYLLVVLTFSLVDSIYWPADYSIRNKLKRKVRIHFNRVNLRLFALFQGVGCIVGFLIFQAGDFHRNIQLTFILSFAGALTFLLINKRKELCLATIALFIGCRDSASIKVNVPNLNNNIIITNTFTYSETIITNVTSAHLLRMNKNLNLEKEVLSNVEKISNSIFILNLNEKYRSFRGDQINASDLVSTFEYYIQNLPDTMRVLNSIKGAKECNKKRCSNFGVKAIGEFKLRVELKEPNPNFLSDLISPVFIIIKKGKPLYERVGECKLPYQTGRGFVSNCTKNFIELTHENKRYRLFKDVQDTGYSITSIGKDKKKAPSLTSMFFVRNPNSSNEVSKFVHSLTTISKDLANVLQIEPSKTLTSSWLGLDTKSFKVDIKKTKVPSQDIKLVIAKSIPENSKVISFLKKKYPQIKFTFKVVPSQLFFKEAEKADVSLLWLTPGYFDFYDLVSIFDCDSNRLCWYNFKDRTLQKEIRLLRQPENRYNDQSTLLKVEKRLQGLGYLAPVGLLNWWLEKSETFVSTHPAGLFMLDITELDYD